MATRSHICDANHCVQPAVPGVGLCAQHWRALPEQLQQRLVDAAAKHWSRAQRVSSVDYLEAWADAVEYIAQMEGRLTRNAYRNLANLLKASSPVLGLRHG